MDTLHIPTEEIQHCHSCRHTTHSNRGNPTLPFLSTHYIFQHRKSETAIPVNTLHTEKAMQKYKCLSKPHDIVIYTDSSVMWGRSGWGFTVKQGGRTVHEDSGAHRVTTSSLTMEVEAVTHAIQWLASQRNTQITHAIILTDSMNLLQKVESGMGCPDWHTAMHSFRLQRLL